MRIGAAVWGTIFLVAGGVLLLNSLNVVPWGVWLELLGLWPILLVTIGLLIIAKGVGSRILAALATLVLLAAAGFVVYASIGSLPWTKSRVLVKEASFPRGVEAGNLRLVLGEGSLDLGSGAGGLLYRARLSTKGRGADPEVLVRSEGDVAHVQLRQREPGVRFFTGGLAEWGLRLNSWVPWDIRVDAGASRVRLDLSRLEVQSLVLDLGAADAEVRFGSLSSRTTATVEAGAARLRLLIPREVGARVALQGGISKTDVDFTLRKVAVRGDRVIYQSDDWGSAKRRLELDVGTGVAQVTVERY